MKIVVAGSGGVGGYFGARLARAGEEVTFVARGAHLQAIREHGMRIRSAVDGEWSVKANAVETLDGHDAADVVLLCVKSYDTEATAELIRPVVGEQTVILSLQNGIDNESKLARLYGNDRVLGGVAYIFSNIEAPGVIAHHQLGRIVFGRLDGQASDRATAFADACNRAGITAEISRDIRKTLWEKYVFLVALAGTTTVTRLPVSFIREVAQTRRLWELQIDELLALADADGAALDAEVKTRCTRLLESLAPGNYSSLYQDLMNGKRLELDTLHGYATRLGESLGVPTPTLFAVYAALRPYLDGAPKIG
jgi:2-dehydropantoate 2-reductase